MTISIVNSLPEDEWRDFVEQNPSGNVFHTPEMFKVFQSARGHRPELWAARAEDGRILVLFLPVRVSVRTGFLEGLSTHSIVYGSLLCAQGSQAGDALGNLLEVYQKDGGHGSVYTELRNVNSMADHHAILSQTGFAYEEHLNYKINLDGTPDFVLRNIGKRTQRNIRRGLNQGLVTIEEVHDRQGLAEAYALLQKTYHLAKVPLADSTLFEAAFDQLEPKGMLRVTNARVDRALAATSFELIYKHMLYGWYGGMDRSFTRYNPNELLMWDILRWGAEHGYKVYDFGGAGKPNEEYGVRDFKAKFGGELVNFGRYQWVANPLLLRLSKIGYQVYRRLL